LDGILAKYDIALPEEKIRASNECCTLISGYHSGVEREVYIGQVAKQLALPQDVIKNQVEAVIRRRIREKKAEVQRTAQATIRSVGDRINPDAIKDVQAASAEETILGLMLIYPEYRHAAADGSAGLSSEDFFTAFGKRVFDEILRLHRSSEGYSPVMLEQVFTPDEVGRLQRMEQRRRSLAENGPSVFRAAIGTLKDAAAKRKNRENEDVLSGIADILARKGKK
jgi:DNA primase